LVGVLKSADLAAALVAIAEEGDVVAADTIYAAAAARLLRWLSTLRRSDPAGALVFGLRDA
jgi:hypothetical protein